MAASTEVTAGQSLRRVLANPSLRRVQLAFAGSLLGDWAYATAITVWAYSEGGAAAVGIFQAVRFVAMAVAGPLGAVIADRVPRKIFMISTDAIRAVLVAVAAICVAADTPAAFVYVLSVVAAIVGAPFRSAQAGLIPQLVNDPSELTASNAVAANLENIVCFGGPALGGLLLAFTDVQAVFWVNVASYVWSMAMVAGVRVPPAAAAAPGLAPLGAASGREDAAPDGKGGFLREVGAGFATIARNRDLAIVSGLAAAQGLLWGAITVFMVLIALGMLGTGPEGVGYLNAVMGVGTVLGGAVILTRTAKGRLAQDMVIGVLGWSVPLIGLAIYPSPVTAVVALAVIGLMDPWVNVGFETIPQRIVADHVLSRVYAAVESALIGAMALGAFLAPALVSLLGFRGALTLLGVGVTVVAAATFGRMRSLDARLSAPAEMPLLGSLALFAPLSPPVLESLARSLDRIVVPAGEPVVREGEVSDRFFVIESGSVEVTQAGRVLRVETAGDFFGEIGLLRDVPRTATVTATEDTVLLALDRSDFLEAVTGQQEARGAAEEVVSRRLAV